MPLPSLRSTTFASAFAAALLFGSPALADDAVDETQAEGAGAATVPSCTVDPSADDAVRTIVQSPWQNGDDAARALACAETVFRARHDRRAVFATLYGMTTARVEAAIKAGRFQDAAWVERYLVAFAEAYRSALLATEEGRNDDVPEAWKISFATAAHGGELVAQDLLLGVNAHVNNDLARALVQVGIGAPGSDERKQREADHTMVNTILHEAVDPELAAIGVLYAPVYGSLPAPVEKLFGNSFYAVLVVGRANAWNRAVLLDAARNDAERWIVRTWIGAEAAGTARAILSPQIAPPVLAALRALEGPVHF